MRDWLEGLTLLQSIVMAFSVGAVAFTLVVLMLAWIWKEDGVEMKSEPTISEEGLKAIRDKENRGKDTLIIYSRPKKIKGMRILK